MPGNYVAGTRHSKFSRVTDRAGAISNPSKYDVVYNPPLLYNSIDMPGPGTGGRFSCETLPA